MNKKIIFFIILGLILLLSITIVHRLNSKSVQISQPEQTEIKEPENNKEINTEETIPTQQKSNKKNFTHTQKIQKIQKQEKPNKIDNSEQEKIKEIKSTPISEVQPVSNEANKIENNENPIKKKKLFAYDIKKFSNDVELIEALRLLEEYGDNEVIGNIQKYGMRVKFDDFVNIVYKRDSYFAMTAYNQYGTRYILINSIYKTAPTEQLACLIAHESMHTLKASTQKEEISATQKETDCWKNLKVYSKTYPDTKLTSRLEMLTKNNHTEIEHKIAKTMIYQEQFSKH